VFTILVMQEWTGRNHYASRQSRLVEA